MTADLALFRWLNALRTARLDGVMGWLSRNGYLWVPVALLFLLAVTRRKHARFVRDGLLAWFLALLVAEDWLKPLIHRARPSNNPALRGLVHVLGTPPSARSYSFPSGTSAACFAGVVVLWAALGRRAGLAAVALSVLLSFARIYSGAHYPSDLLVGAALGAAVGWGTLRFSRWAGG